MKNILHFKYFAILSFFYFSFWVGCEDKAEEKEQKIEKNKTKEKVTASTLEPYIEVAEMMINERDPIKLLQAKSFLEEAVFLQYLISKIGNKCIIIAYSV